MTRREQILKLCAWDKNETVREYIARLDKIIPIIIDENERLRKALEFYADGNSWYSVMSCDSTEQKMYICSRLGRDIEQNKQLSTGRVALAGNVARQALTASPLDALLEGEK